MKYLALTVIFFTFASISLAEELFPPEKGKMTLAELLTEVVFLEGKIVRTTVTCATRHDDPNDKLHRSFLNYFSNNGKRSTHIGFFPDEGLDVLNELTEKSYDSGSSKIYLRVGENGYLEAVGTRYHKKENTYSW